MIRIVLAISGNSSVRSVDGAISAVVKPVRPGLGIFDGWSQIFDLQSFALDQDSYENVVWPMFYHRQ